MDAKIEDSRLHLEDIDITSIWPFSWWTSWIVFILMCATVSVYNLLPVKLSYLWFKRGVALNNPPLPKMKKQDLTLNELRQYDGQHNEGRVLVAINGTVFDVTKGKRFYGPGGPYASFGGHDASRALAMFRTELVKEEYDDLSDLNITQMESIREWEAQLRDIEKFDVVGKLLKPGEEPGNYSDDDEADPRSDDDDREKPKDE